MRPWPLSRSLAPQPLGRPCIPAELDAYSLQTLLGGRFSWVDSLALHLDYHRSSKTLCPFAFPSAYAAQLRDRSGAIFDFASVERWDAPGPRATADDMPIFLRKCSCRSACSLPSRSSPADSSPAYSALLQPPFLVPTPYYPSSIPRRHSEAKSRECPATDHLLFRAQLPRVVQKSRAFSLGAERRDLVRDRRDTLQFWTFCLVAFIGGD
ncbi:hypothetical protein B0T25DRAFT_360065 [Lasiosphaeria hispida]|uniref:Uncharacterized protein n=1 Tax=Lasiosphaeria hispida TaxID=260671 RepID=A0AAJ0H7P1_9PEZI|nr:hypothetical protein B0T25DRAFT_360065 [Lasiosphaeria hispida]